MEQLTKRTCEGFAEVLASKESVPGGGGAAALVGALGVALCSMVGNFTTGKKKYAEYEDDIQRMLKDAEILRTQLLDQVNADAEAFYPLSVAYATPKDDPKRVEILEAATVNACKAPMEMVRLCGKCIELLSEMLVKGSKMLISDVGCGALCCKAAMESAALNVFVNTKTLVNRDAADKMENEVNTLLDKYVPEATRIAQEVSNYIKEK